MVHRLVARLAPDMDVEDLAHQTFVAAFEHLAQYERRARFSTWLCQIAVNKVRDHARAIRRCPPQVAVDDCEIMDCDADGVHIGPERHALARERSQVLARALAQLPVIDRELVVLHYMLDQDYRTVAGVLGISAGAAKVRGFRARRELRRLLMREALSHES